MVEYRVIVDRVSKKFKAGVKAESFLARVLGFFSGREFKRPFWVLKNISFKVEKGEVFGIIGDNGSGKSTLLRVIAGIYDSDNGKVDCRGKLVSLINLSAGFNERLTMSDNIYLCCSLFGLNRKMINERFIPIISFAGLEPFVNAKLYQFSNGMLQRLAFSIAVHCKPDILLLDEAFDIGDEEFKKKSLGKINELVKKGASVIITSHNMHLIKENCARAIWIDKGQLKEAGIPSNVIKAYLSK